MSLNCSGGTLRWLHTNSPYSLCHFLRLVACHCLIRFFFFQTPYQNLRLEVLIYKLSVTLKRAGLWKYDLDATVEYINLSSIQAQRDVPVGQLYAQLGQPDHIAEVGGEGTAFPMLQFTDVPTHLSFGMVTLAGK